MINLSAKITGLIVTTSMGLFLTAVAILCVIPLVQAAVEGRRPKMPDLPAVFENLGIAVAIGGFAFRVTEVAAIGVGLALLGAAHGYSGRKHEKSKDAETGLHPFLHEAILICGLLGIGVLGEYYYIIS